MTTSETTEITMAAYGVRSCVDNTNKKKKTLKNLKTYAGVDDAEFIKYIR